MEHLSIDMKAWELAKQQLAPDASPSAVAMLAQEIKQTLLRDPLTIDEVCATIKL